MAWSGATLEFFDEEGWLAATGEGGAICLDPLSIASLRAAPRPNEISRRSRSRRRRARSRRSTRAMRRGAADLWSSREPAPGFGLLPVRESVPIRQDPRTVVASWSLPHLPTE